MDIRATAKRPETIRSRDQERQPSGSRISPQADTPRVMRRQLLLGHTKIESTVRYLGIEVDDALAIAEQVDV
jgi:hypothetical protein